MRYKLILQSIQSGDDAWAIGTLRDHQDQTMDVFRATSCSDVVLIAIKEYGNYFSPDRSLVIQTVPQRVLSKGLKPKSRSMHLILDLQSSPIVGLVAHL